MVPSYVPQSYLTAISGFVMIPIINGPISPGIQSMNGDQPQSGSQQSTSGSKNGKQTVQLQINTKEAASNDENDDDEISTQNKNK